MHLASLLLLFSHSHPCRHPSFSLCLFWSHYSRKLLYSPLHISFSFTEYTSLSSPSIIINTIIWSIILSFVVICCSFSSLFFIPFHPSSLFFIAHFSFLASFRNFLFFLLVLLPICLYPVLFYTLPSFPFIFHLFLRSISSLPFLFFLLCLMLQYKGHLPRKWLPFVLILREKHSKVPSHYLYFFLFYSEFISWRKNLLSPDFILFDATLWLEMESQNHVTLFLASGWIYVTFACRSHLFHCCCIHSYLTLKFLHVRIINNDTFSSAGQFKGNAKSWKDEKNTASLHKCS